MDQSISPIRILIADDHAIIRRGLRVLIDTHFSNYSISECDSIRTLLAALESGPFTHLILDMQMQDGNTLDIMNKIKTTYPSLAILIYTMSAEEIFGIRMMHFNINGFLSKQSPETEVIQALTGFFNGKKYISTELADLMNGFQLKKAKLENPIQTLSERELAVFNHLLKGMPVKEISTRLDLKATTVATYKARIFDKLGISNIIELKNLAELYQHQIG